MGGTHRTKTVKHFVMNDTLVTGKFVVEQCLGDTYDDGGVMEEKFEGWVWRIWNDLNHDWIKTTRHAILPVDKSLQVIKLPGDCIELIFFGYVDACGNKVPIEINRNLALRVGVEDKRFKACPKCGANDLCRSLDFEELFEDVVINGTTYTNRITRLIREDGSYVEEKEVWTADYSGGEFQGVEKKTTTEVICQLQKSPCGCVIVNDFNIRTLRNCNCVTALCYTCSDENLPFRVNDNSIGNYNVFEEEGYIQLSPDFVLDSAYIIYVSSGMCKNNVWYFPAKALETLVAGAYHLSIDKKRASSVPANEKERAYRRYVNEKKKLVRRMSRLSIAEIVQAFESIPRIPSL